MHRDCMRFTDAYAPSPVCSPTRYSLQTGKSPAALHWTKASPTVTAADGYKFIAPTLVRRIDPRETTIGEILQGAGYATAHYGKWHLSGGGPGMHGYDEHDGDTSNGDAAPFTDPNPVDIFGMGKRAAEFMAKNTRDRETILHSDVVPRVALSPERQHGQQREIREPAARQDAPRSAPGGDHRGPRRGRRPAAGRDR